MIARTWGGRVPLKHAAGFHEHLLMTGVEDYRRHRDCVEVKLLRRDEDTTPFGEVNAIYAEYFRSPYAARTTVAVRELPLGALVEFEAVATQ